MNKSVSAIVQARMNSKRLPYKSIRKLGNCEILEWVIKRLKKSKKTDKIILATTTNLEDEKLVKIARKNNISFFQGSENNVLERFYEASKKFKLKNIVRVCADRPFISWSEIDLLINSYFTKGMKYTFNEGSLIPKTNHSKFKKMQYAKGFGAEIFSFKELEFLYKNAHLPRYQEHVTNYIWENFKNSSIQLAQTNIPKSKRYLRALIDTKKDFNIINNFVKKFSINVHTNTQDIVNYLHKYKNSKGLLINKN